MHKPADARFPVDSLPEAGKPPKKESPKTVKAFTQGSVADAPNNATDLGESVCLRKACLPVCCSGGWRKRLFSPLLVAGHYLVQPPRSLEQLARTRTIGGPDQAVALHHVDQVGGAAVADAQAALKQRC